MYRAWASAAEKTGHCGIWLAGRLVIVTRDSDFEHLAMTMGAPPKAIIVRSQDGHTEVIEALLRKHSADILRFGLSPEASFLIVE